MLELLILFNTITAQLHLPPGLISSLCYVESTHNPMAIHKNDGRSESLGICQIKLKTAKWLGFTGTKAQLMKPKTNIYYAGKYLKYQISRYKSVKKGVVAYNSGHYVSSNVKYLNKVMSAYRRRK